uniref:Uncharacterized protein n=1 Tax=Spironucleus salmonicida TaxID=348837 RepID=V6LR35_9EUKA|eukprot:EST46688.1 Hypothetical protein SS50377_13280 [Spironucleus salmonicida]
MPSYLSLHLCTHVCSVVISQEKWQAVQRLGVTSHIAQLAWHWWYFPLLLTHPACAPGNPWSRPVPNRIRRTNRRSGTPCRCPCTLHKFSSDRKSAQGRSLWLPSSPFQAYRFRRRSARRSPCRRHNPARFCTTCRLGRRDSMRRRFCRSPGRRLNTPALQLEPCYALLARCSIVCAGGAVALTLGAIR